MTSRIGEPEQLSIDTEKFDLHNNVAATECEAASGTLVPSVFLCLVLLYSLFLTQIISGTFLNRGDLDPTINVTADASNTANQAFWLMLFIACLIVAGMRRTPILRHAWALWPLVAYLAWSTATMLWAVDPHVAWRRLILQFCIVGSVWLSVAMIGNARRVRRIVLYVLFVVVLINVSAAAVTHPTALGYAGLFGQKNELGAAAAMAFIGFSTGLGAPLSMERTVCRLGFVMSGLLLIASRSKTSLILAFSIPLVAYAAAFLARGLRVRPVYVVWGIATAALIVTLVAMGSGVRYQDILKVLFGGATFTGRTDIWAFAWSEFLIRPITGFGFNGFWGVGTNSAATFSNNAFLSNILQSHDGYLDILLETGGVGLAIFIGFVTTTFGHCSRALRVRGGVFFLAISLFFVLHNFFESSAFRRFEPAWIVFLIVAVTVARMKPTRTRNLAFSDAWVPAC
ncbi:MAG: O-antigen ligase family protein [Alphaproteobacteria bacterium]|nr:O-antigen ligase family protein [Alphaproteobacteria bacterium]